MSKVRLNDNFDLDKMCLFERITRRMVTIRIFEGRFQGHKGSYEARNSSDFCVVIYRYCNYCGIQIKALDNMVYYFLDYLVQLSTIYDSYIAIYNRDFNQLFRLNHRWFTTSFDFVITIWLK